MKPKQPFIPFERHETIRKEIISILAENTLSARNISSEIRISEKEVYNHLEHIQKSMAKGDLHLVVVPAECEKCGFVFKKRERLKKPGKCPECNSEKVAEPLFSITEKEKPC